MGEVIDHEIKVAETDYRGLKNDYLRRVLISGGL